MARICPGEFASEVSPPPQLEDIGRLVELERKVENLERAMQSQRTIGMVIGIIAQRYGCTTDEAWAYLRRLSQSTNIKVRDAARVLVDAFDGAPQDVDAPILDTLRSWLPGSPWSSAESSQEEPYAVDAR